MISTRALSVWLAVALLATTAGMTPAAAQFVAGRVLDAQTSQPIAAVTIELRAADGTRRARAVTDSAGSFAMQASRIGEHLLVAERIGYRTVSATLQVDVSSEAGIVIRMDAATIVLDPLTVEVRRARSIGALAGYYDRVERNQRVGLGTIITRDRIEERNAMAVTDLLREVPRLIIERGAVRFAGGAGAGSCIPRVYVDGVQANRVGPADVNDLVHPLDLEGVEIYHGRARMPGEFHDASGCGALALWTRRGTASGKPFAWRPLLAAAGLVSILTLLAR